ncbi:hypothetical protein [Nevskia ramosa]|uniref:hypothetical protein n=1 Tax=Nevskia ramosa TaxID=64002 RepID=UPI003D0B4E6E
MTAYLKIAGDGKKLPVAIDNRYCEIERDFDAEIYEIARNLDAVSRKTVQLKVLSKRLSEFDVELSFALVKVPKGLDQDAIAKLVSDKVDQLALIMTWRASALMPDQSEVALPNPPPAHTAVQEIDKFIVSLDKIEGLELTLEGQTKQVVPRVPHEYLPARAAKTAKDFDFQGPITMVGKDRVMLSDRICLLIPGHTFTVGDDFDKKLSVFEIGGIRQFRLADPD